jgi:tRNA threonylcarbamoyladenosine biosynthesis protein TsaB
MKIREKRVLGMDASGFSVSVGIMDSGVAKGLIYINDGSPGSEILLATVDQLLTTLRMDKDSLDAVCVTRGPGSFTSLRISLAVAESLGMGLNIPVYGVDTLQLIAATLPFYPDRIRVIQNAYKGEFYSATYSTNFGRVELLDELGLVKPEPFYDTLKTGDLLMGTGISEMLKKGFDLEAKGVKWNRDYHRNISGISVVEHFLDQDLGDPSEKPLEPIYIRLSDAEINYNKQFGVSQ